MRTATISIFRSLKTWVLMDFCNFSSSSLNLFKPRITKSASFPISFLPLQSGTVGLPSWYCLNPNMDLCTAYQSGIGKSGKFLVGTFVRFWRTIEAKMEIFYLEITRADIRVLKYGGKYEFRIIKGFRV